jgi:hypothetical protein
MMKYLPVWTESTCSSCHGSRFSVYQAGAGSILLGIQTSDIINFTKNNLFSCYFLSFLLPQQPSSLQIFFRSWLVPARKSISELTNQSVDCPALVPAACLCLSCILHQFPNIFLKLLCSPAIEKGYIRENPRVILKRFPQILSGVLTHVTCVYSASSDTLLEPWTLGNII